MSERELNTRNMVTLYLREINSDTMKLLDDEYADTQLKMMSSKSNFVKQMSRCASAKSNSKCLYPKTFSSQTRSVYHSVQCRNVLYENNICDHCKTAHKLECDKCTKCGKMMRQNVLARNRVTEDREGLNFAKKWLSKMSDYLNNVLKEYTKKHSEGHQRNTLPRSTSNLNLKQKSFLRDVMSSESIQDARFDEQRKLIRRQRQRAELEIYLQSERDRIQSERKKQIKELREIAERHNNLLLEQRRIKEQEKEVEDSLVNRSISNLQSRNDEQLSQEETKGKSDEINFTAQGLSRDPTTRAQQQQVETFTKKVDSTGNMQTDSKTTDKRKSDLAQKEPFLSHEEGDILNKNYDNVQKEQNIAENGPLTNEVILNDTTREQTLLDNNENGNALTKGLVQPNKEPVLIGKVNENELGIETRIENSGQGDIEEVKQKNVLSKSNAKSDETSNRNEQKQRESAKNVKAKDGELRKGPDQKQKGSSKVKDNESEQVKDHRQKESSKGSDKKQKDTNKKNSAKNYEKVENIDQNARDANARDGGLGTSFDQQQKDSTKLKDNKLDTSKNTEDKKEKETLLNNKQYDVEKGAEYDEKNNKSKKVNVTKDKHQKETLTNKNVKSGESEKENNEKIEASHANGKSKGDKIEKGNDNNQKESPPNGAKLKGGKKGRDQKQNEYSETSTKNKRTVENEQEQNGEYQNDSSENHKESKNTKKKGRHGPQSRLDFDVKGKVSSGDESQIEKNKKSHTKIHKGTSSKSEISNKKKGAKSKINLKEGKTSTVENNFSKNTSHRSLKGDEKGGESIIGEFGDEFDPKAKWGKLKKLTRKKPQIQEEEVEEHVEEEQVKKVEGISTKITQMDSLLALIKNDLESTTAPPLELATPGQEESGEFELFDDLMYSYTDYDDENLGMTALERSKKHKKMLKLQTLIDQPIKEVKNTKAKNVYTGKDQKLLRKIQLLRTQHRVGRDSEEAFEVVSGKHLQKKTLRILEKGITHKRRESCFDFAQKHVWKESSAHVDALLKRDLRISTDNLIYGSQMHRTLGSPSASNAAGGIHYKLSEQKYIDNGWTKLPKEKLVEEVFVYEMEPANPEYNWFQQNKGYGKMWYRHGDLFAEVNEDGTGVCNYADGSRALEFHKAEAPKTGYRYIIYDNMRPDKQPQGVLAMFDFKGNGVVLSKSGKVRLKYNQLEGMVMDPTITSLGTWKWKWFNNIPKQQKEMVNETLKIRDSFMHLFEASRSLDESEQEQLDIAMLEIQDHETSLRKTNFLKNKLAQLKPKTFKINSQFSLRIYDQANIKLVFDECEKRVQLNLGLTVKIPLVIDKWSTVIGDLTTPLDRLAESDSVCSLQRRIQTSVKISNYEEKRKRRVKA